MAKEHTPSRGLLFLQHTGELRQTAWSLNNSLFCIGCFKKAKDFFFVVCYMYARKNSSWRKKSTSRVSLQLERGFWVQWPRRHFFLSNMCLAGMQITAKGWGDLGGSPVFSDGSSVGAVSVMVTSPLARRDVGRRVSGVQNLMGSRTRECHSGLLAPGKPGVCISGAVNL